MEKKTSFENLDVWKRSSRLSVKVKRDHLGGRNIFRIS